VSLRAVVACVQDCVCTHIVCVSSGIRRYERHLVSRFRILVQSIHHDPATVMSILHMFVHQCFPEVRMQVPRGNNGRRHQKIMCKSSMVRECMIREGVMIRECMMIRESMMIRECMIMERARAHAH
jgi:hypothetical protein